MEYLVGLTCTCFFCSCWCGLGDSLYPQQPIGIVEKRFGQRSVKGGFIALKDEAGFSRTCCAAACIT
jgi:hypothetical protein